MKNVLVHVHPSGHFSFRYEKDDVLVKIQIESALHLGWKPEDILLYTNFPYQYRGVTASIVPESLYCPVRPLSTKTCVIGHLLPTLPDDVYWVHDFDAFQLVPFDAPKFDTCGFTDYGWSPKWCLGSYFVRPSAAPLYDTLVKKIYNEGLEDERALTKMTRAGEVSGYTKLNITYNFGMRNIGENYRRADKPLKVVHFHPFYMDNKLPDTTLNMFVYGKNPTGKPLIPKWLITLFQSHGIK